MSIQVTNHPIAVSFSNCLAVWLFAKKFRNMPICLCAPVICPSDFLAGLQRPGTATLQTPNTVSLCVCVCARVSSCLCMCFCEVACCWFDASFLILAQAAARVTTSFADVQCFQQPLSTFQNVCKIQQCITSKKHFYFCSAIRVFRHLYNSVQVIQNL